MKPVAASFRGGARILGVLAAVSGAAALIAAAAIGAPHQILDRSHLRLVFEDRFLGDTLDLWDPATRPHGRWKTSLMTGDQSGYGVYSSRTLIPNADKQIWVDAGFKGLGDAPLGLDPFNVADGVLTIKGWPTPTALESKLWGYRYVTGMISSEKSFAQRYGYFEIDSEWPSGKGAHPGFWLVPTDASWPPEIDIAEEIGDPEQAYFTLHYTGSDGKPAQDQGMIRHAGSGARFTRFGLLWTPDVMAWYQDGRLIRMIRNPGVDKPCYIMATLEIGGAWTGDPDATTRWPMVWKIRSIRAYALKD